ncbi:C-C chemokine receptor type 4-like [Entelurus aequoreus]|uniref:C-C chemokine receptor type 4-like n=1 Tax=Entelurus aequoreus TaxID=161455 RepID=UPI002B1CFDD6|nr:C-C chemokine receptor type 4-like [Entelurus aequoreus]XP_061919437.1 C-C chemokine receptor type 4-like [Entelurus aequoreus]
MATTSPAVREYVFTRPTSTAAADNMTLTPYDYNYDYTLLPDWESSDYGKCDYERHRVYFLPAIYSTFFLLGLLGNFLVIWVTVCGLRLRNMTDVCLVNLAMADLLLVGSLPFLAHQARDHWIFGDAMCKIVLGIYQIVFYTGIFFITLMSIDRYLAIVHAVYAMRTRTRSFGVIAAGVTWLAGFLSSFPEVLFIKNHNQTIQRSVLSNASFCFPVYPALDGTNTHFWSVFGLFKMNILGVFVPMVIMAFCYTQIIRRLLSTQSSKRQAIHLILVVVAVFVFCWVPYNVASFFKALELLNIYSECESSKVIRRALEITEVMAYFHSCLNPVLYVFVGEKFRRTLLRLIHRAPCALCQLVKMVIPQEHISRSIISQTTSLDERSTAV